MHEEESRGRGRGRGNGGGRRLRGGLATDDDSESTNICNGIPNAFKDCNVLIITLFTLIRYPQKSHKYGLVSKLFSQVYEVAIEPKDPRKRFLTELESILDQPMESVKSVDIIKKIDALELDYCTALRDYFGTLWATKELFDNLHEVLRPKPTIEHKAFTPSLLTRLELHLGDISRYRDRMLLWENEEAIPLVLAARDILQAEKNTPKSSKKSATSNGQTHLWQQTLLRKRLFRLRRDALVTSESAGSDANHWSIGYRSIQKRRFISTRYGKIDTSAEKHHRGDAPSQQKAITNGPNKSGTESTPPSTSAWEHFVPESQGNGHDSEVDDVDDDENEIKNCFKQPINDDSSHESSRSSSGSCETGQNQNSDPSWGVQSSDVNEIFSLLSRREKHVFEGNCSYYRDAKDHYKNALRSSFELNKDKNQQLRANNHEECKSHSKEILGCDGHALVGLANLAEVEFQSILRDAADIIPTDLTSTRTSSNQALDVPQLALLVQYVANQSIDVAFEAAHGYLKAAWSNIAPARKVTGQLYKLLASSVFSQGDIQAKNSNNHSDDSFNSIYPSLLQCKAAEQYQKNLLELTVLLSEYAINHEDETLRISIGSHALLLPWIQLAVLWVVKEGTPNPTKEDQTRQSNATSLHVSMVFGAEATCLEHLLRFIIKALEAYELSPNTTRSGEAPLSLQCVWMIMCALSSVDRLATTEVISALTSATSESAMQAFRLLGVPINSIMAVRLQRENSEILTPSAKLGTNSRSVLTGIEGAQLLKQTLKDNSNNTPTHRAKYISTFDPQQWGNVPGVPDAPTSTPSSVGVASAKATPKVRTVVDILMDKQKEEDAKKAPQSKSRRRRRTKKGKEKSELNEDDEIASDIDTNPTSADNGSIPSTGGLSSQFPSTPLVQTERRLPWITSFVPPSAETLRTAAGEGASNLIGLLGFLFDAKLFSSSSNRREATSRAHNDYLLELLKLTSKCISDSQQTLGEWSQHPFTNASLVSQNTPVSKASPQLSSASFTVLRRERSSASADTPTRLDEPSFERTNSTSIDDSKIPIMIPLVEDFYLRHSVVPPVGSADATAATPALSAIDFAANENEHRVGSKKEKSKNSDPQRDFLIRVTRLRKRLLQ